MLLSYIKSRVVAKSKFKTDNVSLKWPLKATIHFSFCLYFCTAKFFSQNFLTELLVTILNGLSAFFENSKPNTQYIVSCNLVETLCLPFQNVSLESVFSSWEEICNVMYKGNVNINPLHSPRILALWQNF